MAAAANAPNPAATTISGASRERKRDKSAPPVTAPTPSEPSNRPYPRAPKSVSRPRTGISAITPAPQSMKRNVAKRTRRNGGECRAKRRPARIAGRTCSAGSVLGADSLRQARSTAITPRKVSPSSTKTIVGPAAATTKPPMAGPSVRATLTLTPLSVIPAPSSSFGRSSGMAACQAGSLKALAIPSTKASTSKIQGVTTPAKLKIASVPTVMAIASWETIRRRRRSIMSASAPAGSPNRKKGRLSAVRSKDTMSGDGVSDDISQP